jgi:hypothetical protein
MGRRLLIVIPVPSLNAPTAGIAQMIAEIESCRS